MFLLLPVRPTLLKIVCFFADKSLEPIMLLVQRAATVFRRLYRENRRVGFHSVSSLYRNFFRLGRRFNQLIFNPINLLLRTCKLLKYYYTSKHCRVVYCYYTNFGEFNFSTIIIRINTVDRACFIRQSTTYIIPTYRSTKYFAFRF